MCSDEGSIALLHFKIGELGTVLSDEDKACWIMPQAKVLNLQLVDRRGSTKKLTVARSISAATYLCCPQQSHRAQLRCALNVLMRATTENCYSWYPFEKRRKELPRNLCRQR